MRAHLRIVGDLLEGTDQAEAGEGVGPVGGGPVAPLPGVAEIAQEVRGPPRGIVPVPVSVPTPVRLRLGRGDRQTRAVLLLSLAQFVDEVGDPAVVGGILGMQHDHRHRRIARPEVLDRGLQLALDVDSRLGRHVRVATRTVLREILITAVHGHPPVVVRHMCCKRSVRTTLAPDNRSRQDDDQSAAAETETRRGAGEGQRAAAGGVGERGPGKAVRCAFARPAAVASRRSPRPSSGPPGSTLRSAGPRTPATP